MYTIIFILYVLFGETMYLYIYIVFFKLSMTLNTINTKKRLCFKYKLYALKHNLFLL